MLPSEHAVYLVSQLGSRLGMWQLSFDENNLLQVRVGETFLDIQFDAKKDLFLISSEVAVLSSSSIAEVYAHILEFNLVAGLLARQGFIGLNRNSEQLFYIDHIVASHLTADVFEDFVRHAAKIATAWSKLISSPEFLKDALAINAAPAGNVG